MSLNVLLSISGLEKLQPSFKILITTILTAGAFLSVAIDDGLARRICNELCFRSEFEGERLVYFMRFKSIIFLAVVVFAGCKGAKDPAVSGDSKRYPLKGKVISVDKVNKSAVIEHDAIPELKMDAMTMPYPIREDWVWNDLAPGAIIKAELVVDKTAKEPYWLEKIAISAAPNPNQSPLPTAETARQIGKPVPDIRLTDQDGKPFSLTDYRGKAVAVTFIYRECPLPNYCIKMSRNFSDLAFRISADNEKRDKLRLVSISFDPERDTPAKLRQYGLGYLGNPDKPDFTFWRLSVGSEKEVRRIADFFGLRYEVDTNDKTQINHSLVTAVIGPDGNVKKMISGNNWTPDELFRDLSEAAG